MASTSLTRSYDALLTHTSDLLHKKGKPIDNVFKMTKLLEVLKSRIKMEESSGGAKIEINIMDGKNVAAGPYSRYDEVDISPQDGFTAAFEDWRQYDFPVSIDGLSEFQNASPTRIQNLIASKVKQGSMSIGDQLAQGLMDIANCDYTNGLVNTNQIVSIPLIAPVAYGSARKLHGIDGYAGNTAWRAQYLDGGATSTTWAGLFSDMRNMYNTITGQGGGEPNLIVVDQWSHEGYEAGLDDRSRLTPSYGNVGFQTLKFKNADVIWDVWVPDANGGTNGTGAALTHGTAYFLTLDNLTLYVGKGKDLSPLDWRAPANQDARTQLWVLYTQLCTDNRRKHGCLFEIDPTVTES